MTGEQFTISYHQLKDYIASNKFVVDNTVVLFDDDKADVLAHIAFAFAGITTLRIYGYRDNTGIGHIFSGVEYLQVLNEFVEGKLVFPKLGGEFKYFSGRKYDDLTVMEKRKFFGSNQIFKIEMLDYNTDDETRQYFINTLL